MKSYIRSMGSFLRRPLARRAIGVLLIWLLLAARSAPAQFLCTTNADNSLTITGYSGPGGSVNIPASINGMVVSDIGFKAFYGLAILTNLSIPGSISSLGNMAFGACPNLADVSIGAGVSSVGYYAFTLCPSLTNVSLPSTVTNIGIGTFWNCSELTGVVIPPGVTFLGQSAFNECALTRVIIPASVNTLDDYVFQNNPRLTNAFFLGNAPAGGYSSFEGAPVTVYYLPGGMGWTNTFSSTPAVPVLLWNPVIQTSGTNFGVRTNRFGFNVTGTTNIPIVIDACTDLASPAWVALTNVNLAGGWFRFSDASQTNFPRRYYRVRSP